MSDDKMRSEFEAVSNIPVDAYYKQSVDAYKYKQQPTVDHPVNELYESFCDGWQAAQRQGGESVEVNDDMALAFVYAISDGPVGDTEVQEIKKGIKAALANVTPSQAQSCISQPTESDTQSGLSLGGDTQNTLASEICDELFQGLLSCHMNRHEVFEKLRNILPQQQAGEPVATTLASDPLCEDLKDETPWFSKQDWKALAELPPGTKLYTAPQPQPGWVPERDHFAGVTMWVGDKMIMKVVDRLTWIYERETGNALTTKAQECLNELARPQPPEGEA